MRQRPATVAARVTVLQGARQDSVESGARDDTSRASCHDDTATPMPPWMTTGVDAWVETGYSAFAGIMCLR